jgi:regulator of protease activity HflC (stomatin/prohibitin superfamily)
MGGISGILSTVALLGFLAFLAGVGLVVVSASQGRPVRGGVLLAAVGMVFGVVLTIIAQGIIVVQPQERAVVFNTLDGQLGDPRGPGTHIIIPILQEATIYNIAQQEYTMSGTENEGNVRGNDAVRGRTSDGQEIIMDITILYRVSPIGTDVNTVHERLQNRYEENFIRPTARGISREIISAFTAEQIYDEARATLEQEMQDRISTLMAEQGLELVDLLVRDVTFSEEFAQSIEQALVAQQQAERARRQVDQIQAEADQARAEADGLRDARIARAEGDAQAIILEAQAQAEALRLVSEQIAANPLLVQYEYIQQLSDNVSLALVPSNSPFLFDFASLPEAIEGFEAPAIPEAEDIVPGSGSNLDTPSEGENNNGG